MTKKSPMEKDLYDGAIKKAVEALMAAVHELSYQELEQLGSYLSVLGTEKGDSVVLAAVGEERRERERSAK